MSTPAERMDVLDQQQALQTDGLARMLQGQWVGFPSLQADLEALAPGISLEPHPPVLQSEAREPHAPRWWQQFIPATEMAPQAYSWTCSACALDWVLRATEIAPHHTRTETVMQIGYPDNINETYGLMDASGPALRAVYRHYELDTEQAWMTFDQAWALAADTTGQMSGGAWYHWVAIRGQDGPNLWIANSAPGYRGIYDSLSREDFNRLGPFSVVALVR